MKPLRLVLVTRRFWPLVGGAERVMADLGAQFQEMGAAVTLVTACWDRGWPKEIVHQGVPVVRLPQPSLRWIGTWRYMRALQTWIVARRGEFDLIYVSMLKHDAYAVLGCRRQIDVPVVLRAEGAGPTGDVHWQLSDRFGVRIRDRCVHADAIVAPGPIVERELIAAGYPRERVHAISNAVRIPPIADPQEKLEARASLAAAHPLLAAAGTDLIAVYTGRLHEAKGLATLVEAWATVASQRPGAQLWLVGDGPQRAELFEQIAGLGLDGRVVLCGAFDHVDEVLSAADLFILPSLQEGMSLALLEAMSHGRPTVATDIPANRLLVEHEQQGLLVPTNDPSALASSILRLADDPVLRERLAAAGRSRVEEQFSLPDRARQHLELFDRLVRQMQSRQRRTIA